MESDNIHFPSVQVPSVHSPALDSTNEEKTSRQMTTTNVMTASLTFLAKSYESQNKQSLEDKPVKKLSERKQQAVNRIFDDEVLKLKNPTIHEQSQLKSKIEAEIAKVSKKTNPTHIFKVNEQEYTISKLQATDQKTVAIKISELGKFLGEGSFGKVNALNSSLVGIAQDVNEADLASANIKQVVKQPLSDDELEIADMKNDAKITARN